MWVFGADTRAEPVAGGREDHRPCPECQRVTRFVECEVRNVYKAFFLKVGSTTQRRFACLECVTRIKERTSAALR
jgi:hypothetical protein